MSFQFDQEPEKAHSKPMTQTTRHLTLTESLDQFTRELDKNPLTIQAYRTDVSQFIRYLAETDYTVTTPAQVERVHIIEYLQYLKSNGRSGVTRARKLISLQVYFSFLVTIGILPHSPAANIERPMSMLIIVVFIAGYIYIPPAWQRHADDVTYGYPRTYQTDADVGHGGVSHFLVLNLHGTIKVVEIPPNPIKNKPQLYLITQFGNPGADLLPAIVSFIDLNGDGKPDMQVTVYNGSNPTIYILFNDGTTFKPHL